MKPSPLTTFTAFATAALCIISTSTAFAQPTIAAAAEQKRLAAGDLSPAIAQLKAESDLVSKFLTEPLTRDFLSEVPALAKQDKRILYFEKSSPRNNRKWYSEEQRNKLDTAGQADTQAREFDEGRYYANQYGTPIAYALAVDVLGKFGVKSFQDKKIVDYGYGAIGGVRLMAQAGAQVVGIDVDPLLPLLYAQPKDVGVMKGGTRSGKLTLIDANFPSAAAVKGVGTGNDIIISKNTLKKGYFTPDVGTAQINAGVPHEAFLKSWHDVLKPGGLLLIYNISQKLDEKDYKPANDPRSPFTKEQFEKAGFKVLALDADDSVKARQFGAALGWAGPPPQGMGDLETNLFGKYTVVQRAQ
jgi:SAM-dependent methyltransferase